MDDISCTLVRLELILETEDNGVIVGDLREQVQELQQSLMDMQQRHRRTVVENSRLRRKVLESTRNETRDAAQRKLGAQEERKRLRKEVYPGWKVLRNMDRKGATLGYEGVDIMREVETEGKKYFHGTIVPTSNDLQRAAKIVVQASQSADVNTSGVSRVWWTGLIPGGEYSIDASGSTVTLTMGGSLTADDAGVVVASI